MKNPTRKRPNFTTTLAPETIAFLKSVDAGRLIDRLVSDFISLQSLEIGVLWKNGVWKAIKSENRSICYGETIAELLEDLASEQHNNLDRFASLNEKYGGKGEAERGVFGRAACF